MVLIFPKCKRSMGACFLTSKETHIKRKEPTNPPTKESFHGRKIGLKLRVDFDPIFFHLVHLDFLDQNLVFLIGELRRVLKNPFTNKLGLNKV